jgi:DNA repair protein RadC
MQYLKKLNIELIKSEYTNPIKGQLRGPEQLHAVFQDIKDKAQETLISVFLNDVLDVISYDVLSVGAASETNIIPQELFGRTFVLRAKTFVLIHNHPSGIPEPSDEDKHIMAHLVQQSKVMELRFLDFIIVGDPLDEDRKPYWRAPRKMMRLT